MTDLEISALKIRLQAEAESCLYRETELPSFVAKMTITKCPQDIIDIYTQLGFIINDTLIGKKIVPDFIFKKLLDYKITAQFTLHPFNKYEHGHFSFKNGRKIISMMAQDPLLKAYSFNYNAQNIIHIGGLSSTTVTTSSSYYITMGLSTTPKPKSWRVDGINGFMRIE